MDKTSDHELENLFGAARAEPEFALSEMGYARALQNAERAQPTMSLMDGIGGGWGLGGMLVASTVGLWLGIAPPDQMSDYLAGLSGGTVSVTLQSETDWLASLEE